MAIQLTKIVTKGGDGGQTSLGDGSRVDKCCPLIDAIGTVDELNAIMGVLIANCNRECYVPKIMGPLKSIQNDLFDVGADLCVPVPHPEASPKEGDEDRLRVTQEQIARLEALVEEANKELKPLDSFVLPGGTPSASLSHWARTVARRAERDVIRASKVPGCGVNPAVPIYLNRLSDLLFVWSRLFNKFGNEVLWKPGETQK